MLQRVLLMVGILICVRNAVADPVPPEVPVDPVPVDIFPGEPVPIVDTVSDTVVRRTDQGVDGPLGEGVHESPDLIWGRMGNWVPTAPDGNIYDSGAWDTAGQFFRVDLFFDGLINPPGTLGLAGSAFAPYLYGLNPVFGFVEFDMDASVSTGGETWAQGDRYLGNLARWGGKATAPQFADRVALSGTDVWNDFDTPPYVQRSGEEFHIALLGEEITEIEEINGNADSTFDEEEIWLVRGTLFHRAHGYEEFSFAVGPPPGAYEPGDVEIRWKHWPPPNDTTQVTLIYPLTNQAWVDRSGEPLAVVMNGDASDQNSIEEALEDLAFSAMYAPQGQHDDPEWPIIADWGNQSPADYLIANDWGATLLVGMSYTEPDGGGALFAWTDVVADVLLGDVNGDGTVDAADAQEIDDFISMHDGVDGEDGDTSENGSIMIIDFGWNFSIYDLNYDGFVDNVDVFAVVIPGDMDLNLEVNIADVDDFVHALLYQESGFPPGDWPLVQERGDFNHDGLLDGRDTVGFVNTLLEGG